MPSCPSDAQVIGAVQRAMRARASRWSAPPAACPGELHKLWQAGAPGSYHMEYGFSTMGYEIAGGLGVKMAKPGEDVVVMVGDGSYLMMNSEIATSVMLGLKLTIVLLDNRGFGCINRLQMATGGANFNNLLKDARHEMLPEIDFAAHAASMGAIADKVALDRRAGGRAGRGARPMTRTTRARHRHRPADLHRGRRPLVGCRGAGGQRTAERQRRTQGLRGRAEGAAG